MSVEDHVTSPCEDRDAPLSRTGIERYYPQLGTDPGQERSQLLMCRPLCFVLLFHYADVFAKGPAIGVTKFQCRRV